MSNLNYPFEPVAHEDWVRQIQKELRDQADRIHYKDDLEGLELNITAEQPIHHIPFPIGSVETNCVHFERIQEEKESNRRMLMALMQGANALFIAIEKERVDWNTVFHQIELAYIRTEILVQNEAQWMEIKAQLTKEQLKQLVIINDLISNHPIPGCQAYFNGFEIHEIGATAIDELSILLSSYHRHLLTGNQTEALFSLGIGNQYFVQLAKIRAFHYLVHKLNGIHGLEKANYRLHAHIGWMNKSLKDPYTNLLRQTTEAMSAYGGVVNGLIIHPWDEYSKEGKEDFTLRMAINIYNLLSEEAHFNWVQDPMKGSRIVEGLTNQIIEKTWSRIQQLTDMDESSMISSAISQIEKTRQQRIAKWQQAEEKLIGINSFLNTDLGKVNTWGVLPSYLGKEYLIVEKNG
jgi:methylmalonyl-CoA mutase